jgi:flagellar motor switch protein FliN/FliY
MGSRAEFEQVAVLSDVPLEVEIELGRRMMRLRDILDLTAGSIIPMTKTAGDYLDIYVAGAPVGRGEVVVLETNAGVRITALESRS